MADYLQVEWGYEVVYNFTNAVEKVIKQITETPSLFEESPKYRYIRKGFITEHNTMYYRVKPRKKEIEILVFWDNRRNPIKNPY